MPVFTIISIVIFASLIRYGLDLADREEFSQHANLCMVVCASVGIGSMGLGMMLDLFIWG